MTNKIIRGVIVGLILVGIVVFLFWNDKPKIQNDRSVHDQQTHKRADEKPNCQKAYSVQYSTYDISVFSSPRNPTKSILAGFLHYKRWKEQNQQYVLFVPQSISLDNNSSDIVTSLYGQPFVVAIAKNGLYEKFYFPNSVADDDKKLLKGLVLPFQMIVDKDKTNYQSTEQDELGTYLAHYKRAGKELTKTKFKYTSTVTSHEGLELEGTIAISHTSGILAQDGCWFESIVGKERVEVSFIDTKQPVFGNTLKFSLKEEEYPLLSKVLSPYDNKTLGDVLLLFQSGKKPKISYQKKLAIKKKKDQVKKEKIGVKTILKSVDDTRHSDELDIFYLQEHPEAIKEIETAILNNELAERKVMFLVELLARVGTDTAQNTLIEIIQSDNMPYKNKFRAIVAFSSLERKPSVKTLDTLFLYRDKLSDETEGRLASSAILALGAISSNIESSYPETSIEIAEKIVHDLNHAYSNSEERTLLLSASNSVLTNKKVAEMVDIQKFLHSDDNLVRNAAVDFLDNSNDKKSVQVLLEHQKEEENIDVKIEIFRVLAKKNLDKDTISVIKDQALDEKNAKIRYHMIEILGKNKNADDSVQKALEKLLEKETSKDNYKKILEYL